MKPNLLAWLLFFLVSLSTIRAYDPPIGIPDPATTFGWEIDRPTPDWPAQWLAVTPSAVANFYYIDKNTGNNTGNPNGHPGAPRKTPPEGALEPGAFLYIHAGTFTSTDSSRFDWHGSGTSANPIWITGNPTTRPVFQTNIQIGENGPASYFIFENIEISGSTSASLRIVPRPDTLLTDGFDIDHVLVRNVRRVGTLTNSDTNGITVGISQSTDNLPNSTFTDIVIYNCEIYDVGATQDDHGVEVGYHTNRVWVLDNDIHNVGGDSVQGSHYSTYGPIHGPLGDPNKVTENLYIGRNLMYGNGENGIDIKTVIGFVISQNTVYGPFEREQGYGIVAHSGFASAYHPRNGAIIFNNIHTCSGGIYTGFSSGTDNLDIIGNKIWNIKTTYAAQADILNGACVQIGGTTIGANSMFRIVDNTFHDFDRGIYVEPEVGDSFKIHGNIFSSRTANPLYYEFELQDTVPITALTSINLDYNLYTGTPVFRWRALDGLQSRTLTYMKTTAGKEANSILTASPLFVDALTGDFRLTAGSPAIDISVEGPVGDSAYAAFQTRWGISIKTSFGGIPLARPVDGIWDIGAIESALPPNAAPTELVVSP